MMDQACQHSSNLTMATPMQSLLLTIPLIDSIRCDPSIMMVCHVQPHFQSKNYILNLFDGRTIRCRIFSKCDSCRNGRTIRDEWEISPQDIHICVETHGDPLHVARMAKVLK
jgi:hypothetical protein